jgi:hypothetical protein
MTRKRHRLNVAGSFYVEDGCCTLCGVPDVTAPELFGEANDSCFVKRQPETTAEVDRMLRAMITSEVGCIRYAGVNDSVIRRLAQSGESALADVAPPTGIVRAKRDHVGLRPHALLTAQSLADSFVAHLGTKPMPERFRTKFVQASVDHCEVAVAWFEDQFHPITFQRSAVPGFQWLIVGLESLVYDWLADGPLGEAIFFHAHDWNSSRSDGSMVAW